MASKKSATKKAAVKKPAAKKAAPPAKPGKPVVAKGGKPVFKV